MEQLMLEIVIGNGVISFMYAVVMLAKRKRPALSLFFLSLPVLGVCIYGIPFGVLKLRGRGLYDRETLVKRLEIEKERRIPEVEKELDVIPVEDAMEVSSNTEKRALLLNQLKKDMNTGYRSILPAGKDRDCESAHYVAAAKMEIYRRKQAVLAECKAIWEQDLYNFQNMQNYLTELEAYIGSELLSEKEINVYKTEYCEIVELLLEAHNDVFSPEEYSCYLRYLVELGQSEKAEQCWKNMSTEKKNEKAYQAMLQLYYERKDEKQFYQCLDELKHSNINLSAELLKLVRYWSKRRTL